MWWRAASVEAVKKLRGRRCSPAERIFWCCPSAPLRDPSFYEKMERCAAANKRRNPYFVRSSGGLCDVLRTVSLMSRCRSGGDLRARMRTEKGPASLKGTPLFEEKLMGGRGTRPRCFPKREGGHRPASHQGKCGGCRLPGHRRARSIRISRSTACPGMKGDDPPD